MAKKQSKSAKVTEAKPASTKEILAKARKAPVEPKHKPAAKPQVKVAANKESVTNGKSKTTKDPEESSDSSSEEEEEIPKAALVKARAKSSSSSSDSSNEESKPAPKTSTVKRPEKPASTAPMLVKTAVTSKEDSGDDSDSSVGVPAKSAPSKAVPKKSALKKRAATPSKSNPALAKIAPPTKEGTPSESSESSDSDSEGATTKGSVATPSKSNAAKSSPSSEASDSSDSDSDAPVAKRVNGAAAKTDGPSDSSESDSESNQPPKAAKAAPVKATPAKESESSSGSGDSDSSSDEDEKSVAKKAALADSSSDDSDSSEDEDGDVTMADVPAKSAPKLGAKTELKPATSTGAKRKAEDDGNSQAKKAKLLGGTAHSEGDQQTTTIFVGRLSWSVDNDRLAQEFAECGEVESATVQMDRDSGKSRGFGYVQFKTADAVEKALAMNGKEIDGRAVNIDRGTPPDRNKGREQRAKTFGDQISPPSSVLFVGNISFSATEDGIWSFFNEYGVKSVRLPTDRETGRAKGFGYVEFEDIDGAKKAFEASQGAEIEGRSIRLDYSQPRDGPGGGGRGGGRGFGRGGGRGGFDRGGRGRGGGDRGGRGGGDRGGRGGGDWGGRGGRGRGGGARRGMPAFEGKKTTF